MKKLSLIAVVLFAAVSLFAQKVPTPKDVIGFTPGEDRKMPSWPETLKYFQALDAASDRVMFTELGKTTMGRPFVYATISSVANLKQLEKYKAINAKLADPRLIKSNDAVAKQLIKDGKTIVLITCGVHSTEVGSSMSSLLIAERLANAADDETKKILENTIVLLVPSLNPDGVDIVHDWYYKTLGTPYEGTTPPELYHKYTGHDNNRDWYAFTQVETQMTVDKLHNVWHPQITHDIHQQGANGARLFLPPYMAPVEPNVPKQLVEGYTELGNFMADDLRKQGFVGITTDSTYDAWTPARAYSHYHGGVRILSESASARLASPIEVPFERLTKELGYDTKVETPNHRPLWKGGKWTIGDITKQMTTGAIVLLRHASENRTKWLSRFYEVGKDAVRPRKAGELSGFELVRPETSVAMAGLNPSDYLQWILARGGVEVYSSQRFTDKTLNPTSAIIPANQPYFGFAKTLLERQVYPNLLDKDGHPIPPYDVTAHTLSLLMGVEVRPITKPLIKEELEGGDGSGSGGGGYGCDSVKSFNYQLYKSYVPSMDEGWTRFVFDRFERMLRLGPCFNIRHSNIVDSELRTGKLSTINTIIFPDQSPRQMLNGHPKGSMPDEYVGGIGAEGVANLKKYVENGGTLVFFNRASDFAIEQFKLPLKDVTNGLARKDFYIPGSILRTEVDTKLPMADGVPAESIAWFEDSPAFEVTDPAANNVTIVAKYPSDASKILLSGWALGAEKIAGKAALVTVKIGKGKIVLFGFRPQYRAQSLATFPLMFNAIAGK